MRALAEAVPAKVGGAPVGRWADLRLRTLSAVVLGPVALACIWFGGWAWAALMVVCGVGLAVEWAVLCGVTGQGGRGLRAGWLAAGLPYLVVPMLALFWLRGQTAGRGDVVVLIGVVWASDIGAYMVGRVVGGPKLAPLISPGKTWSGAVGGLVAAMAAGVLLAQVVAVSWQGGVGVLAGLAGLLGVASQGGDLFESWVKRKFGVKDSGRSIPGHGGLLDRLDGVLGAAPVAAALVWSAGRWPAGLGGALWN